MNRQQLQSEFETRGIRRVKVGGFDIDGVLRGKYLSLEKFWSALDEDFGFCDVIFGWDIADRLYDNGRLSGWEHGYPDIRARIDPRSFRVAPTEAHTAHFLLDFWTAERKPYPACPRNLLKSVQARLEAAGFQPRCAIELEFWVFKNPPYSREGGGVETLSEGMCGYSWLRAGQHRGFVAHTLDFFAAYGVEIEGMHTETGPGVWEVALRYENALEAADRAALFKTLFKQLCSDYGYSVTFMAKWNAELPGSSGHMHQSLWDSSGSRNLFAPEGKGEALSSLGKHYLAGQSALLPEMAIFYAPFVNSYRRYVPGVWAPLNNAWGVENRTCAFRIVGSPSATATRIESRQAGADLHPHIALASALASGLYGIEQALEPSAAIQGDAQDRGEALPSTLEAALEKARASTLLPTLLGDAFVDHYLRTREWELGQAKRAVSDWELRRYFEAV